MATLRSPILYSVRPTDQPPANFSTLPPMACAMIWWPKQMPIIGLFAAQAVADELFQRRDPVVILIGAVARAGDQPAVGVIDACGEFVVHHRIALERRSHVRREAARNIDHNRPPLHHVLGGVAGHAECRFSWVHQSSDCVEVDRRPVRQGSVPAYNAIPAVWSERNCGSGPAKKSARSPGLPRKRRSPIVQSPGICGRSAA